MCNIAYNTILVPPNVGGTSFPTTQPTTAGTWLNNGLLTYFNGTTNVPYDLNEGTPTSLFGTPLEGDI